MNLPPIKVREVPMSTKYGTTPAISLAQLKAGLPKGIEDYPPVRPKYSVPHTGLHDGRNYLWAYEKTPGVVVFERYGQNVVLDMLKKLAATFKVKILDEYGNELSEWNA